MSARLVTALALAGTLGTAQGTYAQTYVTPGTGTVTATSSAVPETDAAKESNLEVSDPYFTAGYRFGVRGLEDATTSRNSLGASAGIAVDEEKLRLQLGASGNFGTVTSERGITASEERDYLGFSLSTSARAEYGRIRADPSLGYTSTNSDSLAVTGRDEGSLNLGADVGVNVGPFALLASVYETAMLGSSEHRLSVGAGAAKNLGPVLSIRVMDELDTMRNQRLVYGRLGLGGKIAGSRIESSFMLGQKLGAAFDLDFPIVEGLRGQAGLSLYKEVHGSNPESALLLATGLSFNE